MVYKHIEENKHLYNEIQRSPVVVIKVYSNSCAPCKSYAPQYEQLAQRYPYVSFLDVNMRDNLVRVSAVPTTLIINKGTIVEKILGGDILELEGKLRSFLN